MTQDDRQSTTKLVYLTYGRYTSDNIHYHSCSGDKIKLELLTLSVCLNKPIWLTYFYDHLVYKKKNERKSLLTGFLIHSV